MMRTLTSGWGGSRTDRRERWRRGSDTKELFVGLDWLALELKHLWRGRILFPIVRDMSAKKDCGRHEFLGPTALGPSPILCMDSSRRSGRRF